MSNKALLNHEIHFLSPDADWVVFIHGAGGSMITWKHQKSEFKKFFNLVFLDLRDHGQSKNIEPAFKSYNFDIVCDDILRLLDHLKITRAHFVSLSLGSILLQKLNEKRPDLIGKMVMGGGVFRANIKIRIFIYSARFLKNILPYKHMYNLFSFIVLPKKNHENSRRLFRLQSQKLSPSEYLKWVELHKEFFSLLKNFFDKELEKISLVIMGDQDHVFYKAAQRFVSNHPLAQLVVFNNCGHVVNLERASEFNKTALRFLLTQ